MTRAWPVYSVASLYETNLKRMPELSLDKRWLKDREKHVFDISAYHHQFCFGLPLKVLIFPILALEEKRTSFTRYARRTSSYAPHLVNDHTSQ